MATIALKQLGRHLTSVVITGQTISTAGVLSDSTNVATLTAKMEGLDESLEANLEEISSLNSVKDNYVVTSDSFSGTLEIQKVNDSTDPNPLRTLWGLHDNFKLAWTEGTGGSAKTVTMYIVRERMGASFRGKGKQIASLSFRNADTGTDWYTVS